MTTCADLIQECKRHLLASEREQLNILTSSIGTTDTTLTITNPPGSISAGAMLAIDLELLYVWSVSSSTVTVQRAMRGSTAATHAASSLITVNPRFSDYAIFQALNSDLNDLSAPPNGLYKVSEVTLTYNAAKQGYDLTNVTSIIDVLRVRTKVPGPSHLWPEIYNWQLKVNSDTTDFPSTFGLILYESGYPGLDLRVVYSQPFTAFSATTDNVTTTGLPTTAYDIPPLGAAMRLSGVREVQRTNLESQGDTRRATEVPPGAITNSMRTLGTIRQSRIHAESSRLLNQYPIRKRRY